MRKGDLVKFKDHRNSPCGVVVKGPKISTGDQGWSVYIAWSDKYTPTGNYQTSLLEVISESR